MAVRGAVAIIIGADSLLVCVAVGTWGDGAEVEVLGAKLGWDAEGEGVGGVAVNTIGAAAGLTGDGAGRGWAWGCGDDAEDGGKPEEERGVLHCEGGVRCLCMRQIGWGWERMYFVNKKLFKLRERALVICRLAVKFEQGGTLIDCVRLGDQK